MCEALAVSMSAWLTLSSQFGWAGPPMQVPRLVEPPIVDGDLAEWKEQAFTDGVWDMYRLRRSSWYEPWRNRLTDHGDEPSPAQDLRARYHGLGRRLSVPRRRGLRQRQ